MIKNFNIAALILVVLIIGLLRIPLDITHYEKSGDAVNEVNAKVIILEKNNRIEIIKSEGVTFNEINSNWINCRPFSGRLCSTNESLDLDITLKCGASIVFVSNPDGGRGIIKTSASQTLFDTKNEKENFLNIRINPDYNCPYSVPLYKILNPSNYSAIISGDNDNNFDIKIHGREIYASSAVNRKGANSIPAKLLEEIFVNLLDFIEITALAWLVIVVFGLFGKHIFYYFDGQKADRNTELLIGLCVIALVSNSLNYFLSVKIISFIIGLLFIVVVFSKREKIIEFFSKSNNPIKGFLEFVLLMLILDGGIIAAGDKALAYWQTDLIFYEGVSSALINNSFSEMNSIIGYSHRSIDSTVSALISALFGVTTTASWHILIGILMYINYLNMLSLFQMISNSVHIPLSIRLVAISSPVLIGVYYEGYFSQLFFTVIIWGAVTLYLKNKDKFVIESEISFKQYFSLALALSVSIMSYPYFAVLVMVSLLIHFGSASIRLHSFSLILKKMSLIMIFILIMCNMGLFILVNQHEANIAFLNGLAENIVFPFVHSVKFLTILLGMVPFHSSGEFYNAYILNGFDYFETLAFIFKILSGGVVVSIFGLWFVPVFVKKYDLISSNFTINFHIVFYSISALVLLLLYLKASWYGFAKYAWFSATVLPLLLLSIAHKHINLKKTINKIMYNTYSSMVFVASVFSSSYWFFGSNVGVGAHSINLAYVNTVVADIVGKGFYNYEIETSRQKNDTDLVIISQVEKSLKEKGYTCLNCLYKQHGELYWVKETDSSSDGITKYKLRSKI